MEREPAYSPENQPGLILDMYPFSEKVKSAAFKAFRRTYLSLEKLSNQNYMMSWARLLVTARHEVGHASVVRRLGWKVTRMSVIRDGNTLGFTQFISNARSKVAHLWGLIAVGQGGEVGQNLVESVGSRGCGSDMAQSDHSADQLNNITPFPNVSGAVSFGRSAAAEDDSNAEDEALYLMYVGEKAA